MIKTKFVRLNVQRENMVKTTIQKIFVLIAIAAANNVQEVV